MKACPGQSGTGLVLYDALAVPGVITDMCCLLKFTDHYPQPGEPFGSTRYELRLLFKIRFIQDISDIHLSCS